MAGTSNLDKSLDSIIGDYGPKRTGGRGGQRSAPYSSKSKPTQVFVGNLPWSIKWQDLKDMCKPYGTVKRADVLEENGRSKGYGIVIFSSSAEAKACIAGLHGNIVDGRDLTVKLDSKPEQYQGQGTRTPNRQFNAGLMGGMAFGNHFLSSPMNMGNMDMSMMGGMSTNFKFSRPQKKGVPGTQVYVGNLSWGTKWQDLKDLCKQFGNVKRADIAEEEGGRSKGYAIVQFSDKASARDCVEGLNGQEIDGRAVNVKIDTKPNQGVLGGGGMQSGGMQSRGMQFGQHRLTAPSFGNQGGGMQFGQHRLTAPGFGGPGGMQNGGMQFGQHHLMGGFGGAMGGSTVFVGNLPWSVRWQELKDMCRQFGNVIRADIEENEEGKSKGYGIVKFDNPMSAQNCVSNMHGQIVGGRDLTVHLDKKAGMAFNTRGPVRVFVGNLPWSFNKWQDLKDLCRNFGDVIRADIEEESEGRSKGFGIVTFSNATGAQNCILNLHGYILNGRDLTVKLDGRPKGETNTKSKSTSKKKTNKTNWNEEVPDQATLDSEMDDYHKNKGEKMQTY